jgi:hypothetical protein
MSKSNKANEELIEQLRTQREEMQVTQPRSDDAAERLSEVMRQNAKLEMELQEARSLRYFNDLFQ